MARKIIRIGPRGGLIIREDGKRKEYQHKDSAPHVGHAAHPSVLDVADMDAAAAECFKGTLLHGMEHAVVRGSDGKVYTNRSGELDSVDFPAEETSRWPSGPTMTHTHRLGQGFSAADIIALFKVPLSTSEVVAMRDENGRPRDKPFRIYRFRLNLRHLTGDGFACLASPELAQELWIRALAGVVPGWRDAFDRGDITEEQAQCGIFDGTNRAVAHVLGLEYDVIGEPIHIGGYHGG